MEPRDDARDEIEAKGKHIDNHTAHETELSIAGLVL